MPRYVSFDGDRQIPDLGIVVVHGEPFDSPGPLGPPFVEVDKDGQPVEAVEPNGIALADAAAAEKASAAEARSTHKPARGAGSVSASTKES